MQLINENSLEESFCQLTVLPKDRPNKKSKAYQLEPDADDLLNFYNYKKPEFLKQFYERYSGK